MKRRGFTLVELLAVIVILAIIALIATPIILNIINDARRSAALESFKGYIDGAEKAVMINDLEEEEGFPSKDSSSCYNLNSLDTYIEVKGNRPTIDTTDKICIVNGNTTLVDEVVIDGYKISYENGKYQIQNK